MTSGPEPVLLPTDGPTAPPRANGELVFDAPWQTRIFGATVALYEAGCFGWPDFQQRLIDEIAAHEAALETDPVDGTSGYDYWACWLDAFRALADDHGWASQQNLHDMEHELEARPAGHDH